MPPPAETPKTVYFILIPLAIIINIALIVGGYFCFIGGLFEIALILWIVTPVLDIFMIWGIIWGIKFHKYVKEEAGPNPLCLIFGGLIVSLIVSMSILNIVLI
ncbi:MAG: hypothetical protein ACW98D_08310 [Promethearchaeota archaeon]|jgi:hypothetical protein